VSAPELRSVLAGHLVPGPHGHSSRSGVTLCERACDAVEVAARRGQVETVRTRLPGDAAEVAPGVFFVTGPPRAPGAFAGDLERALTGIASVADLSSGLVALQVGGPDSRRMLAKGCRLDLHPKAFSSGQAARTIIAHIPTTLIQVDDAPRFDLFVPTTLARSFVDHLLRAAAEFGCTILPAQERSKP
jgi:heterotetrameric sarcosine oxidase gamma subunit